MKAIPDLTAESPPGTIDHAAIKGVVTEKLQYWADVVKDTVKRTPVSYKKDDLVWLSTQNLALKKGVGRKLIPRFIGPYKVVNVDNKDNAVTLELPASMACRRTWNVSYLKPYHPAEFPVPAETPDWSFDASDIISPEQPFGEPPVDEIPVGTRGEIIKECMFDSAKKGIRYFKVWYEGDTVGEYEILPEQSLPGLQGHAAAWEKWLSESVGRRTHTPVIPATSSRRERINVDSHLDTFEDD